MKIIFCDRCGVGEKDTGWFSYSPEKNGVIFTLCNKCENDLLKFLGYGFQYKGFKIPQHLERVEK